MKNKILFSDNGTIQDISPTMNDYYSGTFRMSFVASEDALYIGRTHPFNSFFLKSTANAEASNATVEVWNGNDWEDVVELIDNTSLNGVSLAQDGFFEFVPNKNTSWQREDTDTITDLTSKEIYNRYWIKITFSNDLTTDLDLKWLGEVFSDDNDLGSEFPEIISSNFKTAMGVTNWESQHVQAAKIIIKDLISRNLITGGEQILNRDDLVLPSISKTAEIIFNSMGDDYTDQKISAGKEYQSRITKALPLIDLNNNAIIDVGEKTTSMGRFYR